MQDARGTSAKHGLADAITRANLYTEAGADCSLVEGPRSTYELQTIANHTTGCRAVSISEGGLTPSHSYQQLKEMGFGMVRRSLLHGQPPLARVVAAQRMCMLGQPVVSTSPNWLHVVLVNPGITRSFSCFSRCMASGL